MTNPIPPPAPQKSRYWTITLGILVGDGIIALLYGACLYLIDRVSMFGMLGLPSLFLMPFLGGLSASFIWRPLRPTIKGVVWQTLLMTLLALAGGAIAYHEGLICLIIAAPFFWAMVLSGAIVGNIIFKSPPTRLQFSILPILAFAVLTEPFARVDRQNVSVDEILIRASPERVWPQVTSFPQIKSSPEFWLFGLGLPYPVSTTSSGDFLDADRACIFSSNAIFREKVSEIVPNEKLTFDIVEIPSDPELVGHLTPHRGQFILRDNKDGTTTLIGSTWYTLHVRPLWYFDLWTKSIFRAVHMRVMKDIQRRSEARS